MMNLEQFLKIFKNDTILVPKLPEQTEEEAMEVASKFYGKILSDLIDEEILENVRKLNKK